MPGLSGHLRPDPATGNIRIITYDFGDDPKREWLVVSIVNQKIQLISIYYGTPAKLHVNPSCTAKTLPHSMTTSNYMESHNGVTSCKHKSTVTEKLWA